MAWASLFRALAFSNKLTTLSTMANALGASVEDPAKGSKGSAGASVEELAKGSKGSAGASVEEPAKGSKGSAGTTGAYSNSTGLSSLSLSLSELSLSEEDDGFSLSSQRGSA